MEILSLFACCSPLTADVSIRQLAIIAQAVLTMTGIVTMLGISRWTNDGGLYRTIQLFFATSLPWTAMKVKFFETHLCNHEREYILAGDETVVGKAGSETFGIDRFFSSLLGKVIRGLGFFVLSLVDTGERKSNPLMVEQRIKSKVEKKVQAGKKKKRKRKKRRPAGSRNRSKREFNFRDAKQHFGLEDFMVTSETGVENAANLSFLMILLSAKLLKNSKEDLVGSMI